ncbi:MAG: DUF512 domain-containing protein [Candidatus Eisenbacteria bacterium]|jgi:putative radical SAM enzyme (TIGR03279 family)|nr:DUF512 domain-containing protein [Candidatus Eisenbacteria bacterium]
MSISHHPPGVAITTVEPGSPAWSLGVRSSDRIISVGRRDVEDALAVMFELASSSAPVTAGIAGSRGCFIIRIADPDVFLDGVQLEPIRPRACANDCLYCFCKQNPPHARATLRFRDEDYRMSFLAGAYGTLSSLTDGDLARIVHDRLGPQYVTVPATDEGVRRLMLGVTQARPLMPTLRMLVSSGICLHAQIVVCPGLNDGDVLEQSLADLATLRPGLSSVALVPVGTTRYTPDPRIRRPTEQELVELSAAASRWSLNAPGMPPWAMAADEVFLALGRTVPARRRYGDMPQLSTGVGMVRRFLDDARRLYRRKAPSWWEAARIGAVTGRLFSPVLSRVLHALNDHWGGNALLFPVENRFFGPSVTVAGLLGGEEVAASIRSRGLDALMMPGDSLNADGDRFIDGIDLSAVENEVGVPVITGELLSEVVAKAGAVLE